MSSESIHLYLQPTQQQQQQHHQQQQHVLQPDTMTVTSQIAEKIIRPLSLLQVIAAPAIALAASLMELRRIQTPLHGPPPPQEVLLVPNTLERTSSTFSSVNPTIVRAASMLSKYTEAADTVFRVLQQP